MTGVPMPEPESRRGPAIAAFVTGTLLALAAGLGSAAAAIGIWLAHPDFALAVRWWRGTGQAPDAGTARQVAGPLLLWGGAALAAAVLAAWPLSVLLRSGALGAVLALSAVAGIGVIGLWRLWPLWHAVEHDGQPLPSAWRGLTDRDASATRGAALAAIVAAVLALQLVLSWPGIVEGAVRWALAAAGVAIWPLAHWLLQRLRPADRLPMPVIEMAGDEAVPEPEPVEGGLDAALYQAARSGRVARALELLEETAFGS